MDQTIQARLLSSKKSPLTRKAYEDDLKIFAHYLGVDSVNEITDWVEVGPGCIADYIQFLQDSVSEHTGRPYAPSTIARRLTSVKEMLTEAAYQGLYPREHLDYIRHRLGSDKPQSQHHAGISAEDQNRLLQAAADQPGLKGERDYLIFRLLLETGVRRAELVALMVRNMGVIEGVPTLYTEVAKGGKTRQIGIERETYELVSHWLEVSGQGLNQAYPLFCRLRKKGRGPEVWYGVVHPERALHPRSLNHLVKHISILAGIESKVTPHSFRVAMVTDAIAGGAPLTHVQKVTGHTTTRMITEVYNRHQYRRPISEYRRGRLYKPERLED